MADLLLAQQPRRSRWIRWRRLAGDDQHRPSRCAHTSHGGRCSLVHVRREALERGRLHYQAEGLQPAGWRSQQIGRPVVDTAGRMTSPSSGNSRRRDVEGSGRETEVRDELRIVAVTAAHHDGLLASAPPLDTARSTSRPGSVTARCGPKAPWPCRSPRSCRGRRTKTGARLRRSPSSPGHASGAGQALTHKPCQDLTPPLDAPRRSAKGSLPPLQ